MPKNERQRHGFQFEDWLKKQFFYIYYTSEWDIPRELNPDKRGGPISLKTAKWKGSIYFGDAIRQFSINEKFTLIVGFWVHERGKKRIVKITQTVISKAKWRSFWGKIKKDDLQKLDRLIKETPGYMKARVQAQELRSRLEPKTGIISLNPKIDSKRQRRLQCSISFQDFFKFVVGDDSPVEDIKFVIWGQKIKPPLL